MNILDYIDWRGDITFEQSSLNEVDNLIFSTLAYLNMDQLVSEDDSLSPTIEELHQKYIAAGYDQSFLFTNPLAILEKASECQRYKNVTVKWYVNKIDTKRQLQFSAVTFIISNNLSFVAFRGTDNTIVGWREDCNISFLPQTPGQNKSIEYVNCIAAKTKGDLIVGGHSKGGNLAVFAASFCDRNVSENRIVRVYSNDGPGFNNEVAASEQYRSILNKTVKILPESSIIGILLSSKEKCKIIKSDAKGIMQHNPYSWCVRGTEFESVDEMANSSIFMDETMTRWIAALSNKEKQSVVNAIFDSLEASGATTFNEISSNKWTSYSAIIKAAVKLDSESKNDIADSIKKLLASGKDAVKAGNSRNTIVKESGYQKKRED